MHSPATYSFPPAFSFDAQEHTSSFPPPVSSGFFHHISASSALSGADQSGDRQSNFDPGLFSPTSFGHNDSLRQHGLRGVEGDDRDPFGSSPREDMDDIFADFTNQDDGRQDDMEEVEISQPNEAREALEVLGNNDGPSQFDRKGSAEVLAELN
ncbi:hypothetical protein KEM54_003933 [Ascosphaera aggregata]|nr:hypothetical protein KEM54_003933 [Ascosphaera aggregata]